VAWIAAHGFDHLRFPIDSRIWLKPDGTLDEAKSRRSSGTRMVRKRGLGAILDVHFIDGADFNTGDASDVRVFTNPALMDKAANLWRTWPRVMRRKATTCASNSSTSRKQRRTRSSTCSTCACSRPSGRATRPRMVYFPCNKWNTIPNVVDLELPAADPNVAVTVHFYEPIVFTHQKAPWVFPAEDKMPAVPFPGKVPDLTGVIRRPGRARDALRRKGH